MKRFPEGRKDLQAVKDRKVGDFIPKPIQFAITQQIQEDLRPKVTEAFTLQQKANQAIVDREREQRIEQVKLTTASGTRSPRSAQR